MARHAWADCYEWCWVEAANAGADETADRMRRIAETGEHRGVFGGPKLEACAQVLLRLRAALADIVDRFRHATDDTLRGDMAAAVLQAREAMEANANG